jgi:hypothetical protein
MATSVALITGLLPQGFNNDDVVFRGGGGRVGCGWLGLTPGSSLLLHDDKREAMKNNRTNPFFKKELFFLRDSIFRILISPVLINI